MRKHIAALAASVVLACLLVGCATTQNTAGRLLASTAITVDGTMQGWANWVVQGQATAEQETKVKAAYTKYQASMSAALAAYNTLAINGDKTVWEQAELVLTQNKTLLLELVKAFTTGMEVK
jgi:hypothetical protein